MNKSTLKCFKISRASFRKIKHPGIGHFVKKCPFFKKKKLVLIWLKALINNLHLPFWIIPLPFCLKKVSFYWSEELFSKNNLIPFFILNKQFLNFPYFLLEIFLSHILCMFYDIWDIIRYMVWNMNNDHENKKLNRNRNNGKKRNLLDHCYLILCSVYSTPLLNYKQRCIFLIIILLKFWNYN